LILSFDFARDADQNAPVRRGSGLAGDNGAKRLSLSREAQGGGKGLHAVFHHGKMMWVHGLTYSPNKRLLNAVK